MQPDFERRRCPNCETELVGAYCHVCGQEDVPPQAFGMWRLLREAGQELTSWQSETRLTVRTLLLRPGRLTADYLSGKRQRYVEPIRLYLVVSAVFFLFFWPLVLEQSNMSPDSMRTLFASAVRAATSSDLLVERFGNWFTDLTAYLRFGSVLVTAIGLWVLLLSRWRLLAALVFSLHYLVLDYILSALAAVLGMPLGLLWPGAPIGFVSSVAVALIEIAYLIPALHTAFGSRWSLAALRAVAFWLIDNLVLWLCLMLAVNLAVLATLAGW